MEQVVRKGEAIIMPYVRKNSHTVKDIMKLPEGLRAELYDGELVLMAAPTMTHQEILMWLSAEIYQTIKGKGGKCKVLPAPFAVYIKQDDRNYIEPDIIVVCDHEKLDESGCHGAPDWVIEIVSPSSEKTDYERKLALYQEAGVKEYWIIDYDKKIITVHLFEQEEKMEQYTFEDVIGVGIYDNFSIDFTKLLTILN